MVFVEKVGSQWWILKTKRFPNSHISGKFNFNSKGAAVKWAEELGYVVEN